MGTGFNKIWRRSLAAVMGTALVSTTVLGAPAVVGGQAEWEIAVEEQGALAETAASEPTASVQTEEMVQQEEGQDKLQAVGDGDAAQDIQPDYLWDFETVEGTTVVNKGAAGEGNAVLHGSTTQNAAISVGDTTYGAADNSVLVLSGGSKGTSWAELPEALYGGVSADTGLTWSFWMKTDADVGSYTRVFSSTNSSNSAEFAYAPYASDKMWNLLFDNDNQFSEIYDAEPQKAVWNYITITVEDSKAVFYVNGEKVSSSPKMGSSANISTRLNALSSYTNHALGKTCSTWSDPDCKVQLDDVAVYKKALTGEEVAAVAKTYGLEPAKPEGLKEAHDGTYGREDKPLTQIPELTTTSADGRNVVKIWKDEDNSYYYSVSRDDKVVIECSALGLTTASADLTVGMELDSASIDAATGEENYSLLQGSTSEIKKAYAQTGFSLTKDNSKVTLYFRVFNDGIAYRYEVDGDITSSTETTEVTAEASEFMIPDYASLWTVAVSQTYEGNTYTKRTVEDLYDASAYYSTPVLAQLGEDSGNAWLLLSEANVYNEEEPYGASVYKTARDSKALQTTFGLYLTQETDESMNQKTYSPSYSYGTSAKMTDVFHTPWRTAVVTSDLNSLTTSSLTTDLNPDSRGDFSWVDPGAETWTWWSTDYDAIEYSSLIDSIDFAAETGMKYCLVDYGWELWDDYQSKIADLVKYADEKGVGLFLWYGVNKFDATHIFDLDSQEAIEEAFAWCQQVGIKGVKVDYINSDSQFAMKVMYNLADIAAKHHLLINYHGCTNPNGENRTYPNILSSEAVAGMENFKWNAGPGIATMLTFPYTRNVIGSMEFTPTAYRVYSSSATSGFMLATSIVYESALQTYAESAQVYEGYAGLPLLADVPTTWDESRLLEGYPGESIVMARRSSEDWYVGVMSADAKTYDVPLDFLENGTTYYAYIYKDKADGTDIEMEMKQVTASDVLSLPVLQGGGCSVKLSKMESLKKTIYDNFTYYEAEDSNYGVPGGAARIAQSIYASNLSAVGYVGGGAANTLTFQNITAARAGEYTLKIFYICGEKRNMYVKVNDGEPVLLSDLMGNPGDWKAVAAKTLTVELQEGDNSICLYNNDSYTPDIDRIALAPVEKEITPTPTDTPTPTPTQPPFTPEAEKPAAPTGVKAVSTAYNKVKVSWKKVSMAAGYKVYQYNSSTKKYSKVADVTGTTYIKGSLKTGKKYTYKVRAYKTVDGGKLYSAFSKSASAKPILSKVTKLKATNVQSRKVKLSWKKTAGASGYVIYRAAKKNGKYTKVVTVKKGGTVKYTNKNLKKDKTYYYKVRAYRTVSGKKVYAAYSKVVKIKVKK